ncbi:MAG: hypothetical protein WCO48_00800 [Candidatus Taylorbacteria bacterium]
MAIEVYKQEQEKIKAEEEKKRRQEAGEPEEDREPLTTAEIIADKEKSDLLGKMLDYEVGPDSEKIMARLKKGEPNEADIDVLSKYREIFDKKMQKVENIKEEITPDMVAELGEHDPSFKKLLEHIDPDKLTDVVQDRLGELAMTDPDRFNKLAKKIEKMQEFKKGDFKKLDDSVKEMCKERNINEDEYMKVLTIKDEKERMKALETFERNSWGEGGWGKTKRFIDSILSNSLSEPGAQKLNWKKSEIDNAFAELDKHKKNIGKMLAVTVKGNDDMRNALANAILGKPTKNERRGFKDAESTPQITESEILKRWEEEKAVGFFDRNGKNKKMWDKMSALEQDKARDYFLDDMKAEQASKRQGGFWDTIFQAIFESFLLEKKASLN